MNRAVEVLVECIPSPLVFSHPVHLYSLPERKLRSVIFCSILVFTNRMYHSSARSFAKSNTPIFVQKQRFHARG